MSFPERPLTPPRTIDDYFDYEPLPARLQERDPDRDYDEFRQHHIDGEDDR